MQCDNRVKCCFLSKYFIEEMPRFTKILTSFDDFLETVAVDIHLD